MTIIRLTRLVNYTDDRAGATPDEKPVIVNLDAVRYIQPVTEHPGGCLIHWRDTNGFIMPTRVKEDFAVIAGWLDMYDVGHYFPDPRNEAR